MKPLAWKAATIRLTPIPCLPTAGSRFGCGFDPLVAGGVGSTTTSSDWNGQVTATATSSAAPISDRIASTAIRLNRRRRGGCALMLILQKAYERTRWLARRLREHDRARLPGRCRRPPGKPARFGGPLDELSVARRQLAP